MKIGIGLESIPVTGAPLSISLRINSAFTWSLYDSRIEDIEFVFDDSLGGNRMGFSEIRYKKTDFGVEADLGYMKWEEDILEPYISLGVRFQAYSSDIRYDLYESNGCECYDDNFKQLTSTNIWSFTSGVGLKIKPIEWLYIDFRAMYYGGWGIRTNGQTTLPDTDSIQIDEYGEPTVNYIPERFVQGATFTVGLFYRMGAHKPSNGADDDEEED
ncbi:MAG: hypothetical protein QNK23_08075 [Crocinitomicaceae bacterium]|nr:hypothetical protein [Crocinitomicaceae bacterium]